MTFRRRLPVLLLLVLLVAAYAHAQDTAPARPWDELRAVYDYEATLPLDLEVDGLILPDGKLRHVIFSSLNDQRVPALVGLPSSTQFGEGPYPAVVLGHGLGGSKDDQGLVTAAKFLLMSGYATITIDYPGHGERKTPDAPSLSAITDPAQLTPEVAAQLIELLRAGAKQTVFDQRRAVDVLETLPRVSKTHIGYAGVSLGAILGSVFTAVEPRLRASVLIVGGADWTKILTYSTIPGLPEARQAGTIDPVKVGAEFADADPLYYAPHIECPTLLLFGAQDTIVPYDPCGKLLGEIAGGEKSIQVLDDWGHGPKDGANSMALISSLLKYLSDHLKDPPQ
jgi:dipeptidyl aminopeptidase/acylaminoacyl peptidase